jgi:hypothetical protein
MKKFQKARLIKREVGNPETNYQNGYWSEGILASDITVGEIIILLRNLRADYEDYTKQVETEGIFTSSRILEINGNLVTTKNSVWEVVEL